VKEGQMNIIVAVNTDYAYCGAKFMIIQLSNDLIDTIAHTVDVISNMKHVSKVTLSDNFCWIRTVYSWPYKMEPAELLISNEEPEYAVDYDGYNRIIVSTEYERVVVSDGEIEFIADYRHSDGTISSLPISLAELQRSF
jgi:hypothetical protein